MTTILFGDSKKNPALKGGQKGKDQELIGMDNNSINILIGDTESMYDRSEGGNDTLIGGNNNDGGLLINGLSGDAGLMFERSAGGSDILWGGNNSSGILINGLAGDAAEMNDQSAGGDDELHGGNNNGIGSVTNVLTGDALIMRDSSKGGNDTLWGGSNNGLGEVINHLFGDAREISDSPQAGDDRLISGSNAIDHMYGDFGGASVTSGGADTFVFTDNFGNDFIHDFRQSDGDRIEIGVAGVDSFDDLYISDNGGYTKIAIEGHGTITLVGITGVDLLGDIIFSS